VAAFAALVVVVVLLLLVLGVLRPHAQRPRLFFQFLDAPLPNPHPFLCRPQVVEIKGQVDKALRVLAPGRPHRALNNGELGRAPVREARGDREDSGGAEAASGRARGQELGDHLSWHQGASVPWYWTSQSFFFGDDGAEDAGDVVVFVVVDGLGHVVWWWWCGLRG
jgi:hypothetical protein